MSRRFSRRQFLGYTVSGTGAVLGAGFFVNPLVARNSSSPNERLNIASVGTRRRAGANLAGVSGENIVALVDVDAGRWRRWAHAIQKREDTVISA